MTEKIYFKCLLHWSLMMYLKVEEGAEIFDEEVLVTEQIDQETLEATLKKPVQCNEGDNDDDNQDRNGPLRRKGGFKVSPGTTRRCSWYCYFLFIFDLVYSSYLGVGVGILYKVLYGEVDYE